MPVFGSRNIFTKNNLAGLTFLEDLRELFWRMDELKFSIKKNNRARII
jgi:hypothetical protein